MAIPRVHAFLEQGYSGSRKVYGRVTASSRSCGSWSVNLGPNSVAETVHSPMRTGKQMGGSFFVGGREQEWGQGREKIKAQA